VIVETSAVVAVVLGEPDAERFVEALTVPALRLISAANLVEAGIVVEARQGPDAARDLAYLLEEVAIDVEPVDAAQARLAVDAWRRFGKGRHPAGLNLGDCFAYALARHRGEPLLFKGNDFTQTDVASVL
jgi:ribonuclease VapC